MSDAERQSPRTAIRKWLQVTDSRPTKKPVDAPEEQQNIKRGSRHHSRRYRTTRHPVENGDRHNEEAGQTHHKHSKSGTRPKHTSEKTTIVEPLQAQPEERFKDTAVDSNSLGLAERLGLHAPFRTFKEYSDRDVAETQRRPRKRRRSRSSTSSYLEPAAANDLSDDDHDRLSHATTLHTAKKRPARGDGPKNNTTTVSQYSDTMLPSPEKLLKSYERRPRHKTRLDRYELKGHEVHSKKAKQTVKRDGGRKKQKKEKRKEKSGAALMHGFTAQNVAHDRLTLKPTKSLGLFGKGKASSPVRRRGLPDLAFSEMTFLNSRRGRLQDSFDDSSNKPLDKNEQRKLTKAADTEAEFSRYFMSAKPTNLHEKVSHLQRYQQDKRRSQDNESPQASVGLGERSFLGFGTCGPNASISPAKSPVNRDSKTLHCRLSRSPTRSTSYLSWSQSRGPSYASPPPDRRQHVEPLQSSKLSNRKRTAPAPHRGQHPIPPVSSPGVQTTSPKFQGVTFRPSSKHGNAKEGPSQNSESRLAVDERLRPEEKSQNSIDTGEFELDAGKVPPSLEVPIPDKTQPVEAAIREIPKVSSPRHETPAHDGRPLLAEMPFSIPHKDQLDDVLEALLRDCSASHAGNDLASHATLSKRDLRVDEKGRILAGTQEHLGIPTHAFVNSFHAPPEASLSASDSSKNPRSASLQLASTIDGSRSTRTPSKGSLTFSKNPSLVNIADHPPTPRQYRLDSGNAWNGYDSCYGRQQEQANLMPKLSTEHLAPYDAVLDGFLGLSGESDHGARPSEQVPGLNPVNVRDDFDDHRAYLHKSSSERNERGSYLEVNDGEWYDQDVDHGASCDSGVMSHKGSDDEPILIDHADDHQKRERRFLRGAYELETEHPLFTPDMPDIRSSWRPHHLPSSSYGLEAYGADTRAQNVDAAFSEFWTPHKLY